MSPLRGPLPFPLHHPLNFLGSTCQHPRSWSVRVLSPRGHGPCLSVHCKPQTSTNTWWSARCCTQVCREKPREALPALVPSVGLEAVVGAWAELGSGPAPSPVASVGSSPMCRGWGSGAILSLPISSKVQLWRLKIPSTWGWMHQKMSSVLPPRSSSHPFQCDCSSSHPEMGSVPCPWIWAGQDLLWPLG